MRRSVSVCAALCIGAAVVSSASGAAISASGGGITLASLKYRGELDRVLREAGEAELVPVTIIMHEQVARDVIRQASENARDPEERREVVTGLLIDLAARSQGDLLRQLAAEEAAGNADMIAPMWISNVIAARVTPAAAARIAVRQDVSYLNWDAPLGEELFPYRQGDGSVITEIECGVQLMRAPQVWNEFGITGKGVVVGVIDTGSCITHTDLAKQLWVNLGEIPNNGIDDDGNGFIDDVNGWSFDGGGSNNNINDTNGHGTHVAGTVLGDGTGGTQTGMAPGAKLMTIKFWNSFSGQSAAWRCIEYGTKNGAHVLSGSFGWPHSVGPDRATWRRNCENSQAAGVVNVYASGNEGGGTTFDNVRTPGDVPDLVTVGATDCADRIASFSSRGPVTWQNVPPYNDYPYPPGKLKPTISAPGVDTKSLRVCTGYTNLSGTSMATPHTSGCIALMLEANRNLTPAEVKQILKDTAVDLGTRGPDNDYGYGRVDCYEAVKAARAKIVCYPDCDLNKVLDIRDFFCFQSKFAAQDAYADCDGNKVFDIRDFFCFQGKFAAGCP